MFEFVVRLNLNLVSLNLNSLDDDITFQKYFILSKNSAFLYNIWYHKCLNFYVHNTVDLIRFVSVWRGNDRKDIDEIYSDQMTLLLSFVSIIFPLSISNVYTIVQHDLQMRVCWKFIDKWRAHLQMGAPSADRLLVLHNLLMAQIGR